MKKLPNTFAVILAGGVGSRFWPLSRELEPKQFFNLHGKKTLLQQTIERVIPLVGPRGVYIVANHQYKFQVQKQISEYSIPDGHIILEPQGKNTAPAIGLAAKYLSKKNPQAIMIILPADHYIANTDKLLRYLACAKRLAERDYLVTIGITPDLPHTGYGYIKVNLKSKVKDSGMGAYSVDKFVEKPDKKQADSYFKAKCYFWNSGIFIWKAKLILEQIHKFLPDLHKTLQIINVSKGIDPVIWDKISPISVDYGVLEKTKDAIVIKGDGLGWTDLGSWAALSKILPKDAAGNIIQGDCIDIKSKNITVISGNRLIATIGLKDLILVDTDDALLVCNPNMTEEVKSIVEKIKAKNRQEYFSHKTVKRPWGSYSMINMGNGFKVKVVQVEPHKRLSLQFHHHRSEHWVVVEGKARVNICGKVSFLKENESIYIPKKGIHRLENPTDRHLKIIEVQCGQYLEEDDIKRIKNDF